MSGRGWTQERARLGRNPRGIGSRQVGLYRVPTPLATLAKPQRSRLHLGIEAHAVRHHVHLPAGVVVNSAEERRKKGSPRRSRRLGVKQLRGSCAFFASSREPSVQWERAASVAPLGLVILLDAEPTADAVGYYLSVLRT